MSSTSKRMGRPPGIDPETLAKGRLYLKLIGFKVPVTEIAADEGVARSEIYRVIALVRAADGAAEQSCAVSAESETQPQPPRRMSRRTAQSRAWEYAEQHLISAFGLAVNSFWVRIVVSVHEDGDGFFLPIGEPDCRFGTRDDLADLFGRQEVDIHGWLDKLFNRGRLIDLDGQGIGIPLGLGLVPGENARGKVLPPPKPARPAGNTPDPRNSRMIYAIQGGRSVSGESHTETSGESGLSPDTRTGLFPDTFTGLSPDTGPVAHTTTTTTNHMDSFSCGSSSPSEPREGVSGESPVKVSGKSPVEAYANGALSPDTSGSQQSRLARQVGELCGYGKPDDADLAVVGEWLTYPGISEPLIFSSIAEDRQRNPLPVHSLGLFTKTIKAALSIERAKAARNASTQPKPPSEADKLLDARLESLIRRCSESPIGPQIPSREAFDAACRTWKPAIAMRWLAVLEGVSAVGGLDGTELPEFQDYVARPNRFEDMMTEAEEALTSPAPDTS